MKLRLALRVAMGFGVMAALAASTSFAALYKWIDENGRVTYGDTPPAGVKAERLTTGVSPADPNAVRDLATKDAEIRKRQQQRADEAAKEEKDRYDLAWKRRQCQRASGTIKSLRDDENIYRYNEKGERVYLDGAAREEAVAQNEKVIRDLGCTPAIQP